MKFFRLSIVLSVAVLASCANPSVRLEAPRSAFDLKKIDLASLIDSNPLSAIQLEGALLARYGSLGEGTGSSYRERALDNLERQLRSAMDGGRWSEACSLSTSLSAAGRTVEGAGREELLLRQARKLLADGQETPAFALAARVHATKPLDADTARDFLEAAVASGQRGTAEFFLHALRGAGGEGDPDSVAFAEGSDQPSDLTSAVVTVWVDRGLRIEKGLGYPDRVIGSAFYIDKAGYLITNYHVISSEVDPTWEGWSRLYIRSGDASAPKIPAKVIGWDPIMDLALLKTEVDAPRVIGVLGQPSLDVGAKVYAIGSPAGLDKTISSGIVSAKGRRFLQLGSVVQIDAAVNAGNSGGPMVDERGRLAGVVFAGIEQFEGVNFAIPAQYLLQILPDLYQGGQVKRPWLGLSLSESKGEVRISYVAPDTPTAEQLVPEGARILAMDGQAVTSIQQAQDLLLRGRVGDLVSLELDGGESYLLRSIERKEHPLLDALKADTKERLIGPLFGMYLAPAGKGPFSPDYIVRSVTRGSAADESGVSENDPLSIKNFSVDKENGLVLLDLFMKRRRNGYLESYVRLGTSTDSTSLL